MGETTEEREIRLRRLSAQLIGLLPPNLAEAQQVLAYASDLVRNFLTPESCREARCACFEQDKRAENVQPLFGRS